MHFSYQSEMAQVNSGSIGTTTAIKTAGTVLAQHTTGREVYLHGCDIEATTNIDIGSTTAGALGLYLGSTEIGALTLTNDMDTTERVPIVMSATLPVEVDATDIIYVKVKTAPAGGTIAGVIKCYLFLSADPLEGTNPVSY